MISKVDAAIAYAARGWRVIQVHGINPKTGEGCTCPKGPTCTSAGKHPVDNGWQKAEPLTEDEIRSTWSGWRADHNVGIATGADSGFWVLDVDPDNGGFEGIKALQDAHEKLPVTLTQKTGSGGYHLLFKMPPDFEPTNRKGGLKEYAGLDVRGTGGQIVASPSATPKGRYSWQNNVEIIDAPDWLLDLLRPTSTPAPPTPAAAVAVPMDLDDAERARLETYAQRVRDLEVGRLTAMREAAVAEGQQYRGDPWNETCFQVACSLLELGNSPWTSYDVEQAYLDLHSNAPRDAGFTDDEVNKVWQSAVTRIGDGARTYPSPPPSSNEYWDWATEPHMTGKVDRLVFEARGEEAPPDAPTAPDAWQTRTWDDLGNGMRVVDHYGRILRWVAEVGRWMLFRDGAWVLVEPNIVQGLIQEMFDQLIPRTEAFEYSNVPEDPDKPEDTPRERFAKWLKMQRMSARIEAAQKEARGRPSLQASLMEFDRNPMLLNVKGSVIDLATGERLEPAPELMLSRQSPVEYDPDATCPLWQAHLDRVLPDVEMQAYLQRILGYALTGSIEEQSLFIHTGDGANGKSVVAGTMGTIMGTYGGVVAPTVLLAGADEQHPTGWADMAGKRWLPAQETGVGKRLDESKIKEFTGGQAVSARFIGKDFFRYVPVGKINLITNHLPILSGDAAMWRRVHLVTWAVKVPDAEQDKQLEIKIRETELPGVLAWLVRGAREWRIQGLRPPPAALEALAAWRGESDSFGEFLIERTMPAPDVKTPTKPLFDAYTAWCFDQNIKPMSQPSFVQAMVERKYRRYRDAKSRGFEGIVALPREAAIAPAPWQESA